MALHRLEPTRQNLHGFFSRELKPVVHIGSGDQISCRIPDAAWNLRSRRFEGDAPEKFPQFDPEIDNGHCLIGPVFIDGAEPGDTLQISVDELVVGEHGWTSSGGWPHEVHKRLGLVEAPESTFFWKLDPSAGTGENQLGLRVGLKPFLGVMGMPVDMEGRQPTPPPRRTGGNLDCKELTVGSSLFLPVEVAGGLFSVGDGHAAQGDGEVCVTAIECPIESARLTLKLHKDMPIGYPRIRKSDAWITVGVHEDLDEAVMIAVEEMLRLIQSVYKMDKATALALASVVVDVRVTQIVNGVKGAHAVLNDRAVVAL